MPPKDNTRDIAMAAQSSADKALYSIEMHTKECASFRIDLKETMKDFKESMGKFSGKIETINDNNKRWTSYGIGAVIGFTALTRVPDVINWLKTMLGH